MKICGILLIGLLSTTCKRELPVKQDSPEDRERAIHKSTEHNSRNSLDWFGFYRSVSSCSDCTASIKLRADGSFVKSINNMNNSELTLQEGAFTWMENGNHILLENKAIRDGAIVYKVAENYILAIENFGANNETVKDTLRKLPSVDLNVENKYWKLIDLNGKAIKVLPQMHREPHLILQAEANRLKGHTGCNIINGNYELGNDERISFLNIATTKMACAFQNPEDQFIHALKMVDSYSIKGDTLWLYKTGKAELAKLEAVYLY